MSRGPAGSSLDSKLLWHPSMHSVKGMRSRREGVPQAVGRVFLQCFSSANERVSLFIWTHV